MRIYLLPVMLELCKYEAQSFTKMIGFGIWPAAAISEIGKMIFAIF